jgi:alginate O-acetyltransferase complex protein AlgI
MSFTSFWFVFFFLAVLALRRAVRGLGGETWLLLAASLAFFMSWSAPCVLLVLFTSLLDFYVGRNIGRIADPARRKRWLVTSLICNLGLLGFFKYANFLLENARTLINTLGGHVGAAHFDTATPPGISYFTFASMSYVLDVYYERFPPCESARDYTLFVSFFPKLLSGPIIRAADFLPQLAERGRGSLEEIEAGLAQFLIGAVKKMVLADQMAGNVSQIFSAPGRFDRFTLVEGLLGYTAQLYCDFSGYSDMAIGCARVLGFRFAENFQMPFSALTITEFWRRWHITMSAWFRDYLFLPLEMATRDNPRPLQRMSLNMTATMLLCGLWHGPSWNYVIWGGIHGIALAVHRVVLDEKAVCRFDGESGFARLDAGCHRARDGVLPHDNFGRRCSLFQPDVFLWPPGRKIDVDLYLPGGCGGVPGPFIHQ